MDSRLRKVSAFLSFTTPIVFVLLFLISVSQIYYHTGVDSEAGVMIFGMFGVLSLLMVPFATLLFVALWGWSINNVNGVGISTRELKIQKVMWRSCVAASSVVIIVLAAAYFSLFSGSQITFVGTALLFVTGRASRVPAVSWC